MSTKDTATVTRRDSATAILRRIGIKPRDYDLFIDPLGEGRLRVRAADARQHLVKLLGSARAAELGEAPSPHGHDAGSAGDGPEPEPEDLTVPPEVAALNDAGQLTPRLGERVTPYCNRLILAGFDNVAIWAGLVEHFGLDDEKKHYPAWYRWRLAKAGKIPAYSRRTREYAARRENEEPPFLPGVAARMAGRGPA